MTTRRLAAILAADVAGFSSMIEKDEEGALGAPATPASTTLHVDAGGRAKALCLAMAPKPFGIFATAITGHRLSA
jgi:hypothetical protein